MSIFDVDQPIDNEVLFSFGFKEKHSDGKLLYIKDIHLCASLMFNPQTSDMFLVYVEKRTNEIKVVKAGHIDDKIDLECIIEKFTKIFWHKN